MDETLEPAEATAQTQAEKDIAVLIEAKQIMADAGRFRAAKAVSTPYEKDANGKIIGGGRNIASMHGIM